MSDEQKEFWDRLAKVRAGMTGLAEDQRFLPMSHHADAETGRLWFISAKGQHLVEAATNAPCPAIHIVSDSGAGLYATIKGTLSLSHDEAKLDEIWGVIAASWFEDGRRDPDIALLEFTPTEAEAWLTPGGVGFLFSLAKSKMTGEQPDMGDHLNLRF